jgi:iron(III) transport system substrate-binding protein
VRYLPARMRPKVVGAAVILLLAAGHGQPVGAQSVGSSASPFVLTGSGRADALVAGARKEGRLTWYTSLAGPVVSAVANAFGKKYPFIKVSTFRAAENVLATKAAQEAQAGQHSWDVMETPAANVLILEQQGFLAPYLSPYAAALPSELTWKARDGQVWGAADRVSYIGYGYNTTLIPASAVPKTLEDLLNPALKARVGIVTTTTGVRWVGAVLHGLGAAKAEEFLAKVAQQDWKVQSISGAAEMGLVAGGQEASSVTIFNDHEAQEEAKGAPVRWVPIPPVVANVGALVANKHAPAPAAAMLFIDFLLGPDGQAMLKEYKYATPGAHVAFAYWVPEAGLSATQYQAAFDRWKALFKRTFGR